MATWSETFLRRLVDIKEAPCGDISIQETCWHSYQASKSLASFWKGLMRVMEMLKGVLAPNITKGWEDMNKLWLKDWKEREHDKERKKKHLQRERERGDGEGEGGESSAPFPPKKRRVKRWPLYKWNSISRHIIPPCSLSWLSFSLRPETIIN